MAIFGSYRRRSHGGQVTGIDPIFPHVPESDAQVNWHPEDLDQIPSPDDGWRTTLRTRGLASLPPRYLDLPTDFAGRLDLPLVPLSDLDDGSGAWPGAGMQPSTNSDAADASEEADADRGVVITAQRRKDWTPEQWRAFEARQAAVIEAEERQPVISVRAAPGERIDRTPQQVFVSDGESGPMVEPTGDFVPEDDPALVGVRDHYRALLRANRPFHEVRRFLRGHGIVNGSTLNSVRQQLNFRRLHPEVPVSAYPTGELDDRWVEVEPHRIEARKYKEELEKHLGKPGAEEVLTQGMTFGSRDEAGGVANVMLNALRSPFTAETFDPVRAYQIGKQAELMRLEDARHNLGWAATPIEVAGAFLSANPRSLVAIENPLARVKAAMKQGASEGFLSGWGYGNGSVDSARGAISGYVLGSTLAGGLAIAPRLPRLVATLERRRAALRPRNYPPGSLLARKDSRLDGLYSGDGHHFRRQAKFRKLKKSVHPYFHPAIDWYKDSKFNVLRYKTPRAMHVKHYLNDDYFHSANMPKEFGGPWLGKDLEIRKHDDLEKVILGSPPALKISVGVPAGAAIGTAGWYVTNELGLPHSSEGSE